MMTNLKVIEDTSGNPWTDLGRPQTGPDHPALVKFPKNVCICEYLIL